MGYNWKGMRINNNNNNNNNNILIISYFNEKPRDD